MDKDILENKGTATEIVLEDVDNSSDTIKLEVGQDITKYFNYNEKKKTINKKLEG